MHEQKKLTIGILVLVICVLALLAMGMLWLNTVSSEQTKKIGDLKNGKRIFVIRKD